MKGSVPKENNLCVADKLKPWLVGLGVLVLIVLGWMIFGKGGKKGDSVRRDRIFTGKTNSLVPMQAGNTLANRPAKTTDSYRTVVGLVMPAVVGISQSSAQPFLQAWQAGRPDTAWMRCPRCGPVVIPDVVETGPIFCPHCQSQIEPAPRGQNQVWMAPSVAGPQPTQPQALSTFCRNCGAIVIRQPGVPWGSLTCPSCGMSRFGPNAPSVQPQILNPMVQQVAMPGFRGLGTGVIVSKRGYILTNSHLVSGGGKVTVTLFTTHGQRSLSGRVVALAADRDLAIVMIDPGNLDLPVVLIGDSGTVRVGDTVLAFGNPFGLSQTVTSGIVSASRVSVVIGGQRFSSLIQTDASVNQGSSGGPLVNLRGEVIAINTAIYSPSQTHTGLGFAVPINQARDVFAAYMDNLTPKAAMHLLNFSVPRAYSVAAVPPRPETEAPENAPAWLGINIQILNDILAEQLNLPVDSGILVNQVYDNSPAAEAGLERGDVILRFDGRRVANETVLRTLLAGKEAGDKVRLMVLRGRKRINIRFKTAGGTWPQMQQAALVARPINLLRGAEIETGFAELVSIGIAATTITPAIAFSYDLPTDTRGVVLSESEGLALKCGIRDGDIVRSVNGFPTPDLLSFLKAIKNANLSDGVLFSLSRKARPVEVLVREDPQRFPVGL